MRTVFVEYDSADRPVTVVAQEGTALVQYLFQVDQTGGSLVFCDTGVRLQAPLPVGRGSRFWADPRYAVVEVDSGLRRETIRLRDPLGPVESLFEAAREVGPEEMADIIVEA
jgi:hypothetical protein